jgi:hypothetical protein
MLNLAANRELREGDVVRTRTGLLSKVVAMDLFEADLLLQSKEGDLNKATANDVEFVHEGPDRLEPLPNVVSILQEGGFKEGIRTCSGAVCLTFSETDTVLTLIPKDNSNLREVFEGTPFRKAILESLKSSFVTRLPHLLESEFTKKVNSLLESNPEDATSELVRLLENTNV